MKKIRKALLFFSSIFIISVIIQGCCTDEYRIIGSGTADIFSIGTQAPLDTIREPFLIEAEFESEIASNFHSLGLINSAYALSCEYHFVNEIDTNSLKLVVDKDFIFNGDTIRSNSDLTTLTGIKTNVLYYPFRTLNILFTEEFINQSDFENGAHQFSFEIETSDGLLLKNEVSAIIQQ